MSEAALTKPFDALQRTFVLPEQPTVAAKPQDDRLHGHAFTIGALQLVIDTARHPCEVYEELPLCHIPGSPVHLVGMANQRGNIVPLFDLGKMVGLPSDSGKNYYLIIGNRDEAVGFRIYSLPRRVEISSEERITTALPIPHLLEPHIRQFFQKNDQIFADWNVQSFLDSFADAN